MHIDWAAFGQVFVVSFGVAVGMIVLFAIGVGLLSAPPDPDAPHLTIAGADGPPTSTTGTGARAGTTRRVTAWICFLACGLSVAYGLYVIVAR